MVASIFPKLLGLLLIAAHIALNASDASEVEVTGILGANVNLTFTFNVSIMGSAVGVYKKGNIKIARCSTERCSRDPKLDMHIVSNHSVCVLVKNLTKNDSTTYWAATIRYGKFVTSNNEMKLTVREEERSSTVPPMLTNSTLSEPSVSENPTSISLLLCIVPAALVVLLAAVIPLIWWYVQRNEDHQPQPAMEGTSVPSTYILANSLALEMDLKDSEYTAVIYQAKRR